MKRSPEQNLRYPLLLIHGLFSSSRTWRVTVKSFVADYDLRFGGEISARADGIDKETRPGDFYTFTFSSNYNLSYRDQAEELHAAVQKIKRLNDADKVVLAGHSMGGLAARALIQLKSAKDVYALITMGTPHYGSPLALLRESSEAGALKALKKLQKILGRSDFRVETSLGFFRRMLRRLFNLTSEAEREVNDFFSSEAFIELAPGSTALEELNRAPLPTSIRYVFITGSLTDFAAFPDPEWIARYRKLNSFWKKFAADSIHRLSKRYLKAPYAEFREYLGRYSREAKSLEPAQLMDFDGAVPVVSQMIAHFKTAPVLRAVLPVFASHNRLTKRPAKIFQALAVCGAVGPGTQRE